MAIKYDGRKRMGIISTKIDAHWNYFLSVESDLVRLSRFIEFDERNYQCFSVENSRILMAAAAEADIVCKQVCYQLNPSSRANSINKYQNEIVHAWPALPRFEVLAPRYGLQLKPWDNWNNPNGVPDWWTANNKIKHHRDTEYPRASLKNVLNAVAGLFVVCLYLYKDKASMGKLVPSPSILRTTQDRHEGFYHGGYEIGIAYSLE